MQNIEQNLDDIIIKLYPNLIKCENRYRILSVASKFYSYFLNRLENTNQHVTENTQYRKIMQELKNNINKNYKPCTETDKLILLRHLKFSLALEELRRK